MIQTVAEAEGVTVERDDKHVYRVKGDPRVPETLKLTSVTTALNVMNKPALIPWARDMSLSKVRAWLLERTEIPDVVGDIKDGPGDSVALVLNPAIWVPWVEEMLAEARALPDLKRDEAGDIGTAAHGAIEQFIKLGLTPDQMLLEEPPPDTDPRITMAVGNFAEWYRGSGITIIRSEVMVYHPIELYAGTMDAVGTMPCQGIEVEPGQYSGCTFPQEPADCPACGGTGLLYVAIDFKTSNGLYAETAMQIAAYAAAHEAMGGPHYSRAVAVRFGKVDADFEDLWIRDVARSFDHFVAAKLLQTEATRKWTAYRKPGAA